MRQQERDSPVRYSAGSFSTCLPANTASATGSPALFLIITRYKLLYDDWRGYLIALFALVYVSNFYIGLFGHVKLEVRKNRAEIKAIEAEVAEVETKKAA